MIGLPSIWHISKGYKYKAHLSTDFGLNASNIGRVINSFSRKMKPMIMMLHLAKG